MMKWRATSIFLLCNLTFVFAQSFKSFNISQNLADPRLVETYDLNGDGLDEVVVASSEGIFIYENQGNAEFEKRIVLDSIQGIFRLTLFDWGSDGDQDIFFTTFGLPQRLAWLENDGSQNFSYHLITDTIPSPFHLRPFDIDKDNDVDLLLSSSSTDELYWLKNDGSDNFSSIDTIGNFVNHFEIADLNGDNDWDIIFGRPYTGITFSEVRAFQNDGNNNFTMQVLRTGFSVIHEVIVEDIDGDNYFDILVPDYNNDRITWLKNDGTYGFSTQNIIISNFDGPSGLAMRDINGDGRKDLIAGSYNAKEIYYFQGTGTVSSFSFSSGSLIYDELFSISDLAIGNFDNQNNLDFTHTDLDIDALAVWFNNGSQVFTQDMLAFSFDSPRAFDMQDLDGDGDQDMAAVSNDGDMVAWMENLGDDVFETHILLTNYEEPYVVRINDLDDDGDFDIIAASDADDRVTWWENDGLGNFSMSHIVTNINGPRDFWIEDFDQDGDKDIVVICYWLFNKIGTTGAQLLRNDGSENFTISEIEDDIRAGRSTRGADMNGDSLVDVVISSYLYTGSKLRIAVNNGAGFGVMAVDDLLCEDFEIVDFDGDSDNDILAIDFSLDSLYFYENLGNLQFAKYTIAYEEDIYGISPRDFDGDGDMDIIFYTGCNCFTNGSGFEWGIIRNDGAGGFTTEYWYQNQSLMRAMETFDYELDGDIDVVLGFDFADRITIYKNLDVDCHLKVNLMANGATTFCNGDSVTLSSSITDTAISYQWYRNDLAIPNATSPHYTADSAGLYQVAVSDTSCTAFSAVQKVVVGKSYHESISIGLCEKDSLILDTLSIYSPGNYTLTYSTNLGCDSVITYQVFQYSTDSSFLSASICSNSFLEFGGQQLSQPGLYSDTLINNQSCDSIVFLNLNVNPVISQSQTLNICNGDSIFIPGGYWVKQTGLFVDSLQSLSGCDSIWSTQVLVNPSVFTYDTVSVCQGDSLLIHGIYQSTNGVYTDTLPGLVGCDSLHSIVLNVLPNKLSTNTTALCPGDSLLLGGAYQTQAGIYYDTLQAANSCDSIVATSLSVLQPAQQSINLGICLGDSVFLGREWRKSAGTYLDTMQASNSCDSIITTNLTIVPLPQGNISTSICQGDSVFLANAWRKASGNYIDTLPVPNSCDSIISTNLTIVPLPQGNISLSICQGDSAFLVGGWRKTPGTYVDTLQAGNSCDSILTAILTVTPLPTLFRQQSICDGDSAFLANAWQTLGGSYIDTIVVSNGCDTVLTTSLAVSPTYNTNLQATICQGDSVYLGGGWQNTAGSYVDWYNSVDQCDSMVTTQLILSVVDTAISRNANTLIANATSASYQWLNCNNGYSPIAGANSASFTPLTNGSYAVEVTQNGCVDTSVCITINNIGLKELNSQSDIVVYPNPSSGVFTLSGTFPSSESHVGIELIDARGALLWQDQVELKNGELHSEINLEHLPGGSYQIRIKSTQSENIKSIIISK